jgi:hypothetical protein
VSVEVNVFHAMEAYSNLDQTNVKCNIRRLSIVEKEKVVTCKDPTTSKLVEIYSPHAEGNKVLNEKKLPNL